MRTISSLLAGALLTVTSSVASAQQSNNVSTLIEAQPDGGFILSISPTLRGWDTSNGEWKNVQDWNFSLDPSKIPEAPTTSVPTISLDMFVEILRPQSADPTAKVLPGHECTKPNPPRYCIWAKGTDVSSSLMFLRRELTINNPNALVLPGHECLGQKPPRWCPWANRLQNGGSDTSG